MHNFLADAATPVTASTISREPGDEAPAIAELIKKLCDDHRFDRNLKKCWSLAKGGEEPGELARPTKERTIVTFMVNQNEDNQRMAKWRQEVGPDRNRAGTTDELGFAVTSSE